MQRGRCLSPAVDFDRDIVAVYFTLKRLARVYCHGDDADDLAAEAVTRALEHRDGYDPARPLLPWCSAIMRNLWINAGSSLEAQRTVPIGEMDVPCAVGADQRVLVGDITGTIEAMRCRSVCVDTLLEHANGYSLAEIAEATGLPLGTVKRRIHDARELLAKALARGAEAILR